MLTRSWGSWSTTTTLIASSHQLQDPEPIPVLPVPPQPDPSVAAAPHELPRAPHAARQHLVDDQVEADAAADVRAAPVGRRDRRRDAIPHISAAPRAADHLRPSSRARATHPQPTAVPPLGHDQPSGHRTLFGGAHVDLDAVRVNVVGLIVEPERRRLAGAEAEVGLGHVDRDGQRIVVPVRAARAPGLLRPRRRPRSAPPSSSHPSAPSACRSIPRAVSPSTTSPRARTPRTVGAAATGSSTVTNRAPRPRARST